MPQRMKSAMETSIGPIRSGVTVIEILVTVGIVGILLALLVPAVQQARTAARGLECRNRLKNIGIACHNLQSASGYFPSLGKKYAAPGFEYSCLVQLLPYVEEKSLFKSLDFSLDPFGNASVIHKWSATVWHCPGEGFVTSMYTSYLGNGGLEMQVNLKRNPDGFLGLDPGLQPRDFVDGLSNTIAVSECAIKRDDALVFDGFTGIPANVSTLEEWYVFEEKCRSLSSEASLGQPTDALGWPWMDWSTGASRYSHNFPPGSMSCRDSSTGRASTSIPSASSRHGNFVFALAVDGSVHSYSFSIDAALWQHLGLRDDASFSR